MLTPTKSFDSRRIEEKPRFVSLLKKHVQSILWGRPQFAQYIVQKLDNFRKKHDLIVDIGCGAWTTAICIAEQNSQARVIWCDIDTFFWWTNIPENFSYLQISPFSLNKSLNTLADVIIAAWVLHHIEPEKLDVFLKDIFDSLNDEWTFVIHEHRISEHPIRGLIDRVSLQVLEFLNTKTLEWMVCSYNFFKIPQLIDVLERNWFKVLHREDTEWRFVTLPSINWNTVIICEKSKKE